MDKLAIALICLLISLQLLVDGAVSAGPIDSTQGSRARRSSTVRSFSKGIQTHQPRVLKR
jgi:hypothetical protein